MTRMTKDETQLLAQAAAIVDGLLPWKKQTPEQILPERTLLDAAQVKTEAPVKEPQELVSGLVQLTQAAKKNNHIDAWFDEVSNFDVDKTFKYWKDLLELTNYKEKIYDSQGLNSKWFADTYKGVFNGATFQRTVEEPAVSPEFNARCKEIFQKAFELVKDPNTWCQGALTREVGLYRQYAPVNMSSYAQGETRLEAKTIRKHQFCSLGAIMAGDGFGPTEIKRFSLGSRHAHYVAKKLAQHMAGDIANFNDAASHAAVVQAWRYCGEANGWF